MIKRVDGAKMVVDLNGIEYANYTDNGAILSGKICLRCVQPGPT